MVSASTSGGKTVIILGAGASHGARVPPSPPLGKDLLDYLDRYLRVIEEHIPRNPHGLPFREDQQLDRLRSLIENAKEHAWTYEQLVDNEVAKGNPYNEDLALMNRLVVAAFIPPRTGWNPPIPRLDEAFSERADVYDDFLSKLKDKGCAPSNVILVTLNYDLLLEQAINRLGGTYDYMLPGHFRNQGFSLHKIHGSINWWGDMGSFSPLEEGKPIPSPLTVTSRGLVYKEIRIEEDPYEACLSSGAGDPLLAHYSPGKPIFVNFPTLAEIRSKAITECTGATRALIIGVHPPTSRQEDETLWELFFRLEAEGGADALRRVATRHPDCGGQVSVRACFKDVQRVCEYMVTYHGRRRALSASRPPASWGATIRRLGMDARKSNGMKEESNAES